MRCMGGLLRSVLILVLGLLASAPGSAQHRPPLEHTTLALTGDTIITRQLEPYDEPNFLALVELLRGADAAFTNLELNLHDYEMPPASQSGGIHLRGAPAMADALAWLGINLASTANNHSLDWGEAGMFATQDALDAADIVYAGTGASERIAREARFLETRSARIALIATTSTYPAFMRAGSALEDHLPRPGVSVLRHQVWHELDANRFDTLKETAEALGLFTTQDGRRLVPENRPGAFEPSVLLAEDRLRLLGREFRRGTQLRTSSMANPRDIQAIAQRVTDAGRQADLVVVSVHAHETDSRRDEVPAFLREFAHAMIDAGADVVVGHGPHVLRGIEIYQGRPVFYSLGNFIFQNETTQRLPAENFGLLGLDGVTDVGVFNDIRGEHPLYSFQDKLGYWESVVALPMWRDGQLHSIELHPISLGPGQPRSVRGRPLLATAEDGQRIIESLAELSKPFGTTVHWEDGRGLVRLKAQETNR